MRAGLTWLSRTSHRWNTPARRGSWLPDRALEAPKTSVQPGTGNPSGSNMLDVELAEMNDALSTGNVYCWFNVDEQDNWLIRFEEDSSEEHLCERRALVFLEIDAPLCSEVSEICLVHLKHASVSLVVFDNSWVEGVAHVMGLSMERSESENFISRSIASWVRSQEYVPPDAFASEAPDLISDLALRKCLTMG